MSSQKCTPSSTIRVVQQLGRDEPVVILRNERFALWFEARDRESRDPDEDLIVCGVCGHNHVHIESVSIEAGDKGPVIVISGWCESDHRFDVILTQRAGQTFARVGNLRRAFQMEGPFTWAQ